jgi:hypothetical protein
LRVGIANLPLHSGKIPKWLFERMKKLAREITIFIVQEFGEKEMIKRLSDPFWFQSFGCILGFDWHSSGLTTTVCGALKDGIKGMERDLNIFVAGGKGATSRKTPSEIENFGNFINIAPEKLIYASRMSAKVDSSALQDGYQLYHHTFVFTKDGTWAVIQQGMNENSRYARRYHWLSLNMDNFVCEPHSAICCDNKRKIINMVARDSEEARNIVTELSRENPQFVISQFKKILTLPRHHDIKADPKRLYNVLLNTYERKVEDFEKLLSIKGVGPKTIRALSLIGELIYGVKVSFNDPVRYSFAHGGKDGYPYPVDRKNYDRSIEILREAITKAKIGDKDRVRAIKKLSRWIEI